MRHEDDAPKKLVVPNVRESKSDDEENTWRPHQQQVHQNAMIVEPLHQHTSQVVRLQITLQTYEEDAHYATRYEVSEKQRSKCPYMAIICGAAVREFVNEQRDDRTTG